MLKYSSNSLNSEILRNLRDFKSFEFHQKAKLAMHRDAATSALLHVSVLVPAEAA